MIIKIYFCAPKMEPTELSEMAGRSWRQGVSHFFYRGELYRTEDGRTAVFVSHLSRAVEDRLTE